MQITSKTRTVYNITGVSENTLQNLGGLLAKGNFPEAAKTGLFSLRTAIEDALADEGQEVAALNVSVKRSNADGSVARFIVSK